MDVELKNLEDQVMVVTGASSGINLVTARKAAKRGARVAPGFGTPRFRPFGSTFLLAQDRRPTRASA